MREPAEARRAEWTAIAAGVAIVGNAVIFGTDVFSAIVLDPAAADATDSSVADLIGRIHHYGDRRLPIPGVTAVVAAPAAAVLAKTPAARAGATTATLAMVAWLVIYGNISKPINKELRAAAASHAVPSNTRSLQQRWGAVIWPRVGLQGLALVGLLFALARR